MQSKIAGARTRDPAVSLSTGTAGQGRQGRPPQRCRGRAARSASRRVGGSPTLSSHKRAGAPAKDTPVRAPYTFGPTRSGTPLPPQAPPYSPPPPDLALTLAYEPQLLQAAGAEGEVGGRNGPRRHLERVTRARVGARAALERAEELSRGPEEPVNKQATYTSRQALAMTSNGKNHSFGGCSAHPWYRRL